MSAMPMQSAFANAQPLPAPGPGPDPFPTIVRASARAAIRTR
jgi:hypothetical protein